MKRPNTRGMTLLELLVGISIILILIAGAGLQIRGLIQKAKVIAAKATINGSPNSSARQFHLTGVLAISRRTLLSVVWKPDVYHLARTGPAGDHHADGHDGVSGLYRLVGPLERVRACQPRSAGGQ